MASPTTTHAPAPARPARGGGARAVRAPARGGGGGPAPAKGAKVGANRATKSARFQKALERLNESAAKGRSHPPPGKKAAEAQAAAQGPVNEKLAGAKSNQVDSMSQAPTGKPEESSFLQLLEAEIEKVIPKTMGETEKFMKGEKKEQLQGSLQGNIAQQKQQATAGLQGATAAAPDPSGVPAKEVTPIPAEAKVIPPAIGASGAIPVRKPDSEVSLQKSKEDVKTTLERERITEKQLQKANDPRFSAVLKEKGKVEAQADAGPRQYRKKEGAALGSAMARASADEKAAIAGFGGARDTSGAEVKKSQLGAKERDELRRKEVADNIEKFFTETKESVEDKLAKLDTEVSEKWDRMMNGAVQQMTTYVNLRLDAYKDDRYGGLFGWALWIKDKLLGLPDDVNVFYEDGRKLFRQLLQASVRVIAADVENRLAEAKGEIEKGRKRVRDYVESLPKDLQAVGTAAEAEVKARFDDLRQAVDDKKQEMANTLAQRAKDAYDASEKALKEIQDANKGLVAKFIEAVGEVLEVLAEIVSMLGRILVKAASAIGDIVSDPIGFLENLLSAVKRGIGQFRDRFWDHLKAGFLEWMFGAMGEAGIEVPKDFTLGSVLKLVLQVLGLTWDNIRPRIVKLVGPRGMALLEKAYEVIGVLWKGGFAALWDHLKEYLGDLKEKIVAELKDFLVVTIVKAAITKIATMFNPAGALIQAIITIYNTVMFFIENIRRILAFVESVIDSIARIAKGDVGGAADYIESAMARTVPIIIAFLARLLGVSGVAQRVRSAINKLRAMVSKGIDKVLEKLVAGLKSMFGGDKAKAEEKKPGEQKPGEQKPGAEKAAEGTPAHEAKWNAAVKAVNADIDGMKAKGIADDDIPKAIPGWRTKHGFSKLRVQVVGAAWEVMGSMSAEKRVARADEPGSKQKPFKLTWPKPPTSQYEPIYLGGPIAARRTQETLGANVGGKDSRGFEIRQYDPEVPKALPDDTGAPKGPTIGLAKRFRIHTGKIVGPLSEATTPGGDKLNRILKVYGYRPQKEDMQADHAHEIQLGGEHRVDNLWPLESSKNGAAGNNLKNAEIEYPDSGIVKKIADLKKAARQYWFRITKFKY